MLAFCNVCSTKITANANRNPFSMVCSKRILEGGDLHAMEIHAIGDITSFFLGGGGGGGGGRGGGGGDSCQ